MIQDRNRPLVLASASPRRRELLKTLGLPFEVRAADIDEAAEPAELPRAYVQRMAREKAEALRPVLPDEAVVLAADTTVVARGRILGKPEDRADCLTMLSLLSDAEHHVYTAVALALDGQLLERLSVTTVWFRALTRAEMEAYWASGEPADKAGGYAIQGLGGAFVRQIQGSYSGVVGLPIYETAELLTIGGYPLILGHHD
ncbi:MAG: Maf family protein [Gammaproteobacteria bacterium]|jgi:septum formation protein|nr:Maf family protein [Gammaproteobacteria bacterium]